MISLQRLAPTLSHEIPQAIFCSAGFAKSSFNQRLDSLLRGWLRAPRHRDQPFRRIVITCSTPS